MSKKQGAGEKKKIQIGEKKKIEVLKKGKQADIGEIERGIGEVV